MKNSGNIITQFSTVYPLLVGLYDGEFTVEDLMAAGTFGLGCSHGIDGELILLNGECLVARNGQPMKKMAPSDRVPFAQVATCPSFDIKEVHDIDKTKLEDVLVSLAASKNMFIGLRLTGKFESIKLRRPPILSKPYKPLIEIIQHQEEETINNCEGTLLGFWAPKEFQGLTVAGLHVHFISVARDHGGHVLDFNLSAGKLEYAICDQFMIRVPTSKAYRDADLTYENMDAHIKEAEG